MNKRNNIIYWIATLWLALGMVSTAVVQLIQREDEIANFQHLGYPAYLLPLLAVWKLFGVVAILIPRSPMIKEWAYAGFFFAMSGAIVSHLVVHDPATEIFPSLLLLVLTIVSWLFRPSSRKINFQ